MDRMVPLLRERGVDQATLDRLLITNPARVFDIA